jgi:hypothetical protein
MQYNKNIMRTIIENLLTIEECQHFIDLAEKSSMDVATITTPNGSKIDLNYRNNDRYIFDDQILAQSLFDKIKSQLIYSDLEWEPIGLNERFKIYRYKPGQSFALHVDASFIRNEKERSFQTFLIYLNENYKGGETEFFGMETIPPKTGTASLFMHHLMHEGLPVLSGVKYVLRTDVMYKLRLDK